MSPPPGFPLGFPLGAATFPLRAHYPLPPNTARSDFQCTQQGSEIHCLHIKPDAPPVPELARRKPRTDGETHLGSDEERLWYMRIIEEMVQRRMMQEVAHQRARMYQAQAEEFAELKVWKMWALSVVLLGGMVGGWVWGL